MRLIEGEIVLSEPSLTKLSVRTADIMLVVSRELGLNLQSYLYALWVFHANSVILGFKRMDRFLYGCASVLLGSKLGECLKRTDDIIMLWRRQLKKITCKENIEDNEETLRRYKKAVFETEVNLMITFGFDLDIKLATDYLRLMESYIDVEMYVNTERCIRDFYRTQLVLYYEPHLIALAGLLTASRLMNYPLSVLNNRPWYRFFSESTQLEAVESLNHLLQTILQQAQEN